MESVKQITKSVRVGDDRILTLELPEDAAGHNVDVVLTYVVVEGEKAESWVDFVNRTYGMFADDPIERPDQPPQQDRDWNL